MKNKIFKGWIITSVIAYLTFGVILIIAYEVLNYIWVFKPEPQQVYLPIIAGYTAGLGGIFFVWLIFRIRQFLNI